MKFSIMATERTNNFTDPAIQAKITGLWEKNSEAVKKAAEKGMVIALKGELAAGKTTRRLCRFALFRRNGASRL